MGKVQSCAIPIERPSWGRPQAGAPRVRPDGHPCHSMCASTFEWPHDLTNLVPIHAGSSELPAGDPCRVSPSNHSGAPG